MIAISKLTAFWFDWMVAIDWIGACTAGMNNTALPVFLIFVFNIVASLTIKLSAVAMDDQS